MGELLEKEKQKNYQKKIVIASEAIAKHPLGGSRSIPLGKAISAHRQKFFDYILTFPHLLY